MAWHRARRARVIIDNCVHPSYRDVLNKYFEDACQKGGQTPHLREAMQWHINLEERGHMLKGGDPKKPPAHSRRFSRLRKSPCARCFPFANASASIPAPSNGRSLARILLLPSYRQARRYRCRRATGASCNPVLAGPATMTQIPERILVQAHTAAKQPQPLTPEQEAMLRSEIAAELKRQNAVLVAHYTDPVVRALAEETAVAFPIRWKWHVSAMNTRADGRGGRRQVHG